MEIIQKLTSDEKALVQIRDELYSGKWNEMEKDLRKRLTLRPYVFKIYNRIEKDLKEVSRLRKYEQDLGKNLADFLKE